MLKTNYKYLSLLIAFAVFIPVSLLAQQKTVNTKVFGSPVYYDKTFTNGIMINQKGFSVRKAFLVFDNGTRVPLDNKVGLNQVVNLAVFIDKGWTIVNGKAFPGGSEDIKLNNGYQVMKTDDLFADYSINGIDAADARYITLKSSITKLVNKKYYVVVHFRIWDKKSTNEITGIYNYSIK